MTIYLHLPIKRSTRHLELFFCGCVIKRSICSRQCATAHSANLLDTHGELPRAFTCKDKKWPKVVRVAFERRGTPPIFESRKNRGIVQIWPSSPSPATYNDVNRRLLSGHLISASWTIKRHLILYPCVLSGVMERVRIRRAAVSQRRDRSWEFVDQRNYDRGIPTLRANWLGFVISDLGDRKFLEQNLFASAAKYKRALNKRILIQFTQKIYIHSFAHYACIIFDRAKSPRFNHSTKRWTIILFIKQIYKYFHLFTIIKCTYKW